MRKTSLRGLPGGLGSAVPPDPGMYANFLRRAGSLTTGTSSSRRPETPAEAALDSAQRSTSIGSNDDPCRLRAWKRDRASPQRRVLRDLAPGLEGEAPGPQPVRQRASVADPHRILWNASRFYLKPRGVRPVCSAPSHRHRFALGWCFIDFETAFHFDSIC